MEKDRALELLNAIIEQFLVAEPSSTVIKYMLHIGATKDELMDVFHFPKNDVEVCEYELSNEEWTGGPIFY